MNLDLLMVSLPALCVGLLVALTHAPLGLEVLKRNIIFIDLAIAQIAGLGLLIAIEVLHLEQSYQQQIIALLFALSAALKFRLCEKYLARYQEAIIGCSYVAAASLAVLILSQNPHGAEVITHLLSGQVLFVTWQDILHHAPIYIAVLALWFIWPSLRQGFGFYTLFALAITSSVQLVGVYMVFASLILPALAAATYQRQTFVAWLAGFLSVVSGVLFAMMSDLPAGPTIVISFVLVAILFQCMAFFMVKPKPV